MTIFLKLTVTIQQNPIVVQINEDILLIINKILV